MEVGARPAAETRMPALDGLRGIAVLLVIAYHLVRSLPERTGQMALLQPLQFGWVGVDLFFVLSGFLITGILYDRLGSKTYFRSFYGRRALRILPLHLATLAALVAGYAALGGPRLGRLLESVPWHVAFLTNVRVSMEQTWGAAPFGTSHLWSLAVEEQFYLVWPFAVAFVARAYPTNPREALIRLCVAVVAAAVVVRVFLLGDLHFAAYTLFPARMDALAIGSGLALWVRGPRGVDPALSASVPVMIACAAALATAGAIGTVGATAFDPLQRSFGYTLWAFLFAGIVVRAAVAVDSARALSRGPLAWTGRISFGLYVLHFPVLYALRAAGAQDLGPIPFVAMTIAITFGLAIASWRYLEQPALRLKHHFKYETVTA